MTQQYPQGSEAALLASPADWISPGAKLFVCSVPVRAYSDEPETPHGVTGAPNAESGVRDPATNCKVVLNDTDHSYFWIGLKQDSVAAQRAWVWQNFTRGNQCLFMDPYLDPSHEPGRNNPAGDRPDPYWDTLREHWAGHVPTPSG